MKASSRICPICNHRFSYKTDEPCPNCNEYEKAIRDGQMNLALPTEAVRTDAEWIADYQKTYQPLSDNEIMECDAQGIDPEMEVLSRRFKVLMSMLLETRKMIRINENLP